jgi:hypothetical protein
MTGFGVKIDIFVPLAIIRGASHTQGEMSEIFFDHPGVCFPRQLRFSEQ